MAEPRYRVGCAGMFAMGMDYGVRDELEALASCLAGPVGCEVLDTQTGEWIGPYCQEDEDEIRARLAARGTARDAEEPDLPLSAKKELKLLRLITGKTGWAGWMAANPTGGTNG